MDTKFKFLFIGDSTVGKSSLITKYTDNTFSENKIPTIGVDFKSKNLVIDGKNTQIQLWDMAGQERFRSITSSYYRYTDAIIICFDLTNIKTFDNIKTWLNNIYTNCVENIIKILVGTKTDLEHRAVSRIEAEIYAHNNDMNYVEISSKTNTSDEIGELLIKRLVDEVVKPNKIHKQKIGSCGFKF